MSNVEAEGTKPWWWKPLWIGVPLVTIALAVVNYLLLHAPLERVISGLALTLVMIYFAYYIRVHPSRRINRAIYITLGASGTFLLVLFGGAFILKVTGWPPPERYLGEGAGALIFLIAPWILGGFVGDWIGRRRNYRLPLSFEDL